MFLTTFIRMLKLFTVDQGQTELSFIFGKTSTGCSCQSKAIHNSISTTRKVRKRSRVRKYTRVFSSCVVNVFILQHADWSQVLRNLNFSLRGKYKYVIYRLGRSVLEKYFLSVSEASLGLVLTSQPENNIYLRSNPKGVVSLRPSSQLMERYVER